MDGVIAELVRVVQITVVQPPVSHLRRLNLRTTLDLIKNPER